MKEQGKEKEMSIGVPELWFGSVRCDSAAICATRYGNGSIPFSVVTFVATTRSRPRSRRVLDAAEQFATKSTCTHMPHVSSCASYAAHHAAQEAFKDDVCQGFGGCPGHVHQPVHRWASAYASQPCASAGAGGGLDYYGASVSQ